LGQEGELSSNIQTPHERNPSFNDKIRSKLLSPLPATPANVYGEEEVSQVKDKDSDRIIYLGNGLKATSAVSY
jgi:hypothetical protein